MDPLELFMKGIDETVKKEDSTVVRFFVLCHDVEFRKSGGYGERRGQLRRYYKRREENRSGRRSESILLSLLILVTYDKDGNPIKAVSKEPNVITSLQREASYPPCTKDFYSAESTTSDALKQWVLDYHISIHNLVTDSSVPLKTPPPCPDFRSLPLPSKVIDALLCQFSHPTPIQAASLPLALAGRNIIASSPTGSGKTLCYLLPLAVHISGQP